MPANAVGGHVEEAFAPQHRRQGFVRFDAATMQVAVSVGEAVVRSGMKYAPMRGTIRDVADRLYICRPFFGSAEFAARCGRGKAGEEN